MERGRCRTGWPARSRATGRRRRRRLDPLDVDGLGPLVSGLGVVRDARALLERAEALFGDARIVDEQVLAGLVWSDEAESLVVVEPLHGACRHASSGVCGPHLAAQKADTLARAAGPGTLC